MADSSRIVLVDGYAQFYRSFFAIRGLTNSRGEPTNALFGFARFLLQMDDLLPATRGAVVIDKGLPAKRLEVLPSYKANRPPIPDDLKQQIPLILEWIETAGWTVLQEEGEEADDLMAGVVHHRRQYSVVMVSADKDLAQLVQPGVELAVPAKKSRLKRMGKEEVFEQFGVRPDQIADYLALVGDSSDNIPGVEGVGRKTAAKLLDRFDSIDGLMENLGEVSSDRIRGNLERAADDLKRNRRLVKLEPVLPGDWDGLDSLERKPPAWERLIEMARDQQFKSLVAPLQEAMDRDRNPTLF